MILLILDRFVMIMHIQPVPLEKSYRLLNHGPTVLVSAQHDDIVDVMAAAWACALEFSPAKVTIVLDKMTRTRELVEQSGYFVLQIPNFRQLKMTHQLGSNSLHGDADKLAKAGTEIFYREDYPNLPLVQGCNGWILCKVISNEEQHQQHDLFIGEVLAAYADERIFKDGHWQFAQAEKEWYSLHYMAGGTFYLIGEEVQVED